MKSKKFLSFVLVFVLIATLILPAGSPALALGSSTTLDVTDTVNMPANVSYSSGVFTIDSNSVPVITVTGGTAGSPATNTIVVAAGVTGLTLNLSGVSITTPSGGKSPIDLQSGATVTLTLAPSTSNTLDASSEGYRAGIHSGSGSTLTINGTGALIARGGACAAGIGGSSSVTAGEDGGTITINADADVQAYGGQTGAGIGGGGNSSNDPGAGGVITIAGNAHVTATGGAIAAGIGGANAGAGGTIHIGGSAIVNATATIGGAGIGSGGLGGDGGNITIDGGTVTAVCSSFSGAGIGGGNSGGGGNITINGGTVMAQGDNSGAGIGGGGYSGTGANITIGDSAIVMAESKGSGKPAIDAASGSSGTVINAKLGSAVSGSTTTYLKCGSAVLPLPAGYKDFAFSAAAATSVGAYSDQGCATATFLGSIVTTPGNAAEIPATNLSTNPTDITSVNYLTNSVINVGDSSVRPSTVGFSGGVFTINNNTISPITIVGSTSVNTIAVASGVTNLTLILNGVSITSTTRSPIDLKDNSNVTIQPASGTSNTLDASGANRCAGLNVPGTATVTISGSTGVLTAKGGSLAAGIGSGYISTTGTINISGGIINASGTGGGAGIGGGANVSNGTINISGGVINASGTSSDGAGIGGGSGGSGGAINISGGTVTAAGSFWAAGIGGGGEGEGGNIAISGGSVTAVGGSAGGPGIGGGNNSSTPVGGPCFLTVSGNPTIMAAATYAGGLVQKPAIDGATGKFINPIFNTAVSTTDDVYLKCGSKILRLPAGYKSFAFCASSASPVKAYSDQSCSTFLGSVVVSSTGAANIPTNYLTTVKLYTAAVTVKKDASTWTATPPAMQLSTSGTSLTGAISGTLSSGVYTFAGLDAATTYYVWDTTNNQYTGKSIVSTSPNVTANYYTVTLTRGTGITSTSGSGTYLGGANVPISATVSGGCFWDRWTQTSGGADVSNLQSYTIQAIGAAVSYTASAAAPSSAPFILTTSLPDGTVAASYSQNMNAIFMGDIPTWSITGGSLPAGLSLDTATGSITGTPTAAGTSTFTIQALNSHGSHSRTFSITISNIYLLTVNLDGGNGATSSGSYASGAAVSIDAGTKSGFTFAGWQGTGGGTFADASSASTTYTMPGNAASITATWTPVFVPAAPPATPSNSNTIVIVDGHDHAIGTEKKDDSRTTATVDQGKLTDEIGKASNGSSTIFPVSANSNVTAQLVVKNVEDMAQKDMTLTVRTGNVAYNLNTTAIDTTKITSALGNADSKDIPFNVSISNSSAVVNGATVVLSPVEFTITATYNGKTVTVDTFSCFINRTVEITAEQAAQVTTAVVVRPDGTTYHVPTKVSAIDGKYYAVFSSLTNSTYAVVQHPVAFSDAAGSWAKASINNMGSRMVVNGVGDNKFAPDRDITRAEYAAIIVRALGLAPGLGTNSFADVKPSDWYFGYVETAVTYGLVNGYSATAFGPLDKITREQAMTMTARAMKLTGLAPKLSDSDTSALLKGFADSAKASDYALSGIAACVKTGVILGRSGNSLAPKASITRAEVAAIAERLLQKSNLI